ncbi:sortase [Ectobacillus ponti]|uniref:Sortase n=1 Tax=Ectobacillus ponti TaxID=2961894 RepID=A0AA41XAS9_9BACI|nr:sortase [Ectobacillus ponti]MCP8969904.1 sortase [Ectobacillus ponti]
MKGRTSPSCGKASAITQEVCCPGEHDNSILSGHNDSVFRHLDKLRQGDTVTIRTDAGSFTYMVSNTRIVAKEDRSVIVPHHAPMLTLTTCYPFWHLGDAPQRYIVTAVLIRSM